MLNIFILYICLFTLVKDVSFYRMVRKVLKLLKSDSKYNIYYNSTFNRIIFSYGMIFSLVWYFSLLVY